MDGCIKQNKNPKQPELTHYLASSLRLTNKVVKQI
jgi:hypothetical protein